MKLADLSPRFYGAGGEGVRDRDGNPAPERSGVGIGFDCPCGCGTECYVPFENPLDGGPPLRDDAARALWHRSGASFDNLTLAPSILRISGCGWHGFVRGGEIVNA